jgi:branched-chain amino acid aminotransferase
MTRTAREPDWQNLGFGYTPTPWRFQAEWRDGAWTPGALLEDPRIVLEEGACALHYAQQCFEGLKAFRGADGRPVLFRPEMNAARLARSAERLVMPAPPAELFLRAVKACVAANEALLPPHDSGASLYVRPLLLGVGDNLGLRPATRYLFRVFCAPVGPYFPGGMRGIRLLVTDQDRAAPRGTGMYKVGGNYAGGLLLSRRAKEQGYDEVLYLDPLEHRYLDEAGSANVFLIEAKDGRPTRFVTPGSPSILPSVTLDSLLTLAREDLGLEVERRRIAFEELAGFQEMGCAGTAVVVAPVAEARRGDDVVRFEGAPGPTCVELHRRLTGIQRGRLPDPRGWVVPVEA